MKRERITNAQIMEAINGLCNTVNELNDRVTKLEETKKTATKSAPKARKSSTTKATKTAKTTTKTTPKKSAPTTKEEPKKKLTLNDFEPKKYDDGHYRWGIKSDGFNQKSYMGMRKAYCVYKATNGEFMDSDKAYKAGVRIDYSEGGAYAEAKKEFEKKFKYVKKGDRQ